ncbi:DEAD/DEAH box helicase family protein [Nocardioides sp. KC13]|uniref:DEAD/DEAH box helicase family protein n=1 Tax=Nocardioides turkmenicus TaxID=2711220 RepID=A0A6M1R5V5_9ACTN|nr:SNF2-related protein [Nocardioides sp. KC13]NGN92988.1 DEAD/DEAH box helicase family protein [Nocardioides sp. KC13]
MDPATSTDVVIGTPPSTASVERFTGLTKAERKALPSRVRQVSSWSRQAASATAARAVIEQEATEAVDHFRASAAELKRAAQVAWRSLALDRSDGPRLAAIARRHALEPVEETTQELVESLAVAAEDVAQAKKAAGARRLFVRGSRREEAELAGRRILDLHQRASEIQAPARLDRLGRLPSRRRVRIREALLPSVGLLEALSGLGSEAALAPRKGILVLRNEAEALNEARRSEEPARRAATEAGNAVRSADTDTAVRSLPVDELADLVRIEPLLEAGIRTVHEVIHPRSDLRELPGVGPATAMRMQEAAQALWQRTYDEMPLAIDHDRRTPAATRLLARLAEWEAGRRTKDAGAELALVQSLRPLIRSLDSGARFHLILANAASLDDFQSALRSIAHRAEMARRIRPGNRPADPWDDFEKRPADYYAMLSELGFLTEDEDKIHGDLSAEIIEAVRAQELRTNNLTASLRGYQHFGVRFALVQMKVIIGDEMGLGKTLQSLAVLAHLHAMGASHTLVVCPAAVVTNWVRETDSKTTLIPHRLHGNRRSKAAKIWVEQGGVAVTTYETLNTIQPFLDQVEVACVVVDEAHMIKSPRTQRTERVRRALDASERAILLTGTPMENRIDEFRNLVSYLRPDLLLSADEFNPHRFRKQVAPVYLRRNQEDVLTELPDLVEVEDWLPLSPADERAYAECVRDGNFMAMRQAAMLQGTSSAKVERLIEIVGEAEENGRRVIVFSHFRKVLDDLVTLLPGEVFGPLTGSVPAEERQQMVDEFSAAGHGAVLVTQIVAGGVGLNIQSASVVVICEPQLKPTIEWQAIARARRMGQLQSVQVHRLLSEVGVDQRVHDILAAKAELFDDFARVSATAASSPEAYETSHPDDAVAALAAEASDAEIAREVVATERQRLGV